MISGSLHHKDHDGVIKWKHFPRYWPAVRGIHRSTVNSPHKGQWRGALMFSLICVWINAWVNNHEAGDLRRHRAHHDVIVMMSTALVLTRAPRIFWFQWFLNQQKSFSSSTMPISVPILLWNSIQILSLVWSMVNEKMLYILNNHWQMRGSSKL